MTYNLMPREFKLFESFIEKQDLFGIKCITDLYEDI